MKFHLFFAFISLFIFVEQFEIVREKRTYFIFISRYFIPYFVLFIIRYFCLIYFVQYVSIILFLEPNRDIAREMKLFSLFDEIVEAKEPTISKFGCMATSFLYDNGKN
jgi:hypothetical protein